MENIFNKINMTKDLYLTIYNYLSCSHKYILKINDNNELFGFILIKYDRNLFHYCIKIISDFNLVNYSSY